jgi:hypothetical protein
MQQEEISFKDFSEIFKTEEDCRKHCAAMRSAASLAREWFIAIFLVVHDKRGISAN